MDKADWLMDRKDRYVIQSYWTSDPLVIQNHKTYVCDLHFNEFMLYEIAYTPKPNLIEDSML